jgi:hypothetical protein
VLQWTATGNVNSKAVVPSFEYPFLQQRHKKATHHQIRLNITNSEGNGEYNAEREELHGNKCFLTVK